jgi:cell division protein FtsW
MVIMPLAGYRSQRIRDYQPPWTCEPRSLSYHDRESLIALGVGGVSGRGIGQGHQAYGFLPEMHTDYPLASVGEELGFLGTAAVVLLFGVIFVRGMRIAVRSEDRFRSALAAGLTISLSLFAWINAGVTTTLLPTTGQTMPFLSYVGVGTVVSLTSVGILDAIHRSNV